MPDQKLSFWDAVTKAQEHALSGDRDRAVEALLVARREALASRGDFFEQRNSLLYALMQTIAPDQEGLLEEEPVAEPEIQRIVVNGITRSRTTLIYQQLAKLLLLADRKINFRYEPYPLNSCPPKADNKSSDISQLHQSGQMVHGSKPRALSDSNTTHDSIIHPLPNESWDWDPLVPPDVYMTKVIGKADRLRHDLERYPDLQIVACLCNPVDVIDANPDGTGPSLEECIQQWRTFAEEIIALARYHPDNVFAFCYEAFQDSPDAMLEALMDFLGLDNMGMFMGLSKPTAPNSKATSLTERDMSALRPEIAYYENEVRTQKGLQHPTSPIGMVVPHYLGGIAQGGMPGLSLVTCAMNRTENLLKSLQSWISHTRISEIIIVDWSSKIPVELSIAASGIDDSRIRVIRVDDEPRWVLSYAFNAGFRTARYEYILKADADIVLSEDFFERNPLPDRNTFVAGNWRTAEADQVYVNGFFYTSRMALASVGGFNEFITTYGWDDDDLYTRLEQAGFKRQDVQAETVHHLHHSDEERTGEGNDESLPAKDVICATPRFKIQRNRRLCDMMPSWGGHKQLLPLRIKSESQRVMTLARGINHENVVPEEVFDEASRQMLQELMSWDYGSEIRSVDPKIFDKVMQRPVCELSKQAFLDAMADPAPPTSPIPDISSSRDKLYIDAQHGLGNRLRAIGSAAAIAAATDRELVVIWQPDEHCDCRLHDLFDYDGAVEEHSFAHEAVRMGCDLYNYMTAEVGAEKDALIVPRAGHAIYARSAFVLNSEHSNWTVENRFIRSLRPVEAIRDLVDRVRNPNDVSAHVRMEGGKQFEHLPYESPKNWTIDDHAQIAKWREKSHFAHFMARIDALTQEGRAERIFLAADRPETYEEFQARYGARVAFLPRTAYDRSAEQLRYAMADAILLSRAPLLLGSTWSSFSELAMRLSEGGMNVEMSGKNF